MHSAERTRQKWRSKLILTKLAGTSFSRDYISDRWVRDGSAAQIGFGFFQKIRHGSEELLQ